MHGDRQLAGQGDGRALEAYALSELESPGSQVAVGSASGQDDRRSFIKEASEVMVSSARDMALEVNLAGLVSARCQTDPSSDRARVPEVVRAFDCSNI